MNHTMEGQGGCLRAAARAWLEEHPQLLQEPADGGCLVLDAPLIDLAAGQQHPEVVAALLSRPGAAAALGGSR